MKKSSGKAGRILAVLLCLALLASSFDMTVFAAEDGIPEVGTGQ